MVSQSPPTLHTKGRSVLTLQLVDLRLKLRQALVHEVLALAVDELLRRRLQVPVRPREAEHGQRCAGRLARERKGDEEQP